MKKVAISSIIVLSLLIACIFLLQACIIQNPKPEECKVITMKVTKITEGGVKDIVFHNNSNNFYYINRGLEQGLNLDTLKTKVLNKTVTLHLAKVLSGRVSNHISQLALDEVIIYTEF